MNDDGNFWKKTTAAAVADWMKEFSFFVVVKKILPLIQPALFMFIFPWTKVIHRIESLPLFQLISETSYLT